MFTAPFRVIFEAPNFKGEATVVLMVDANGRDMYLTAGGDTAARALEALRREAIALLTAQQLPAALVAIELARTEDTSGAEQLVMVKL